MYVICCSILSKPAGTRTSIVRCHLSLNSVLDFVVAAAGSGSWLLRPRNRCRVGLVIGAEFDVLADLAELLGVRAEDHHLRALVDHVEAVALHDRKILPVAGSLIDVISLRDVPLDDEPVLEDHHLRALGREREPDEEPNAGGDTAVYSRGAACGLMGVLRRGCGRQPHCFLSAADDQARGIDNTRGAAGYTACNPARCRSVGRRDGMPIRFRCSRCNRLLGIARRKAGTETTCPHCGATIMVPPRG